MTFGRHCAGCGYAREPWHELGSLKCPIETADKNGRRGKWRDPAPMDPYEANSAYVMRRDYLARMAAYDAAHAPYEPVVVPPPIVPARPPTGPGELAGYQGRQAVGLGRKAVAAGWLVEPWYWRAYDGTEGCAVKMLLGDLYAVATWERRPGQLGSKSGWSADLAYGVRRGDAPVRMTHTQLEGVVAP